MGPLKPNKGSALVAVMLVLALLLIMGLAFLSQKGGQYEAAVMARASAQARELARAGLADFEVKFAKDRTFPPPRPQTMEQYSYSENLTDMDDNPFGGYNVTVNYDLYRSPYWLLRVNSEGFAGERTDPDARFFIYTEIDMAPEARGAAGTPNPSYRQRIIYREQALPDESAIP